MSRPPHHSSGVVVAVKVAGGTLGGIGCAVGVRGSTWRSGNDRVETTGANGRCIAAAARGQGHGRNQRQTADLGDERVRRCKTLCVVANAVEQPKVRRCAEQGLCGAPLSAR